MLKVGIIGLDTSHVTPFAKAISNERDIIISSVFPCTSEDFRFAADKVSINLSHLKNDYGAEQAHSLDQLMIHSDVIWMETADARNRFSQFKKIADAGKPVYINKPLALSLKEADQLLELAEQKGVPVMSSSALRFAKEIKVDQNNLVSAACFGPIEWQKTQNGYFWYGIHLVDMLHGMTGAKVKEVSIKNSNKKNEFHLKDTEGRNHFMTFHQNGSYKYEATISYPDEKDHKEIGSNLFDGLIKMLTEFTRSGKAPLSHDQMLDTIRITEALNHAQLSSVKVRL
ncbi:Gfo/Idh/MocA family protein [Jeotgalibacillus terrae]|uniref:Gfo/Idh/MocA family protein n=1 Tax=Jeotgalibacillus terrae TaxID=587735 RepID=A0ABW5ZEV9_9BACL|nr:Gfo/Idh/MocA family oxidoreductase [Jeotgalibacillus terrae]MBM7580122.1 putative dehydrogenase [Jeotgalibacillus terrae]